MKKIAFLAALMAIFFYLPVFACEDCNVEFVLGLEETAQKADLIIIGRKVAEHTVEGSREWPAEIDIQVLEILKGNTSSQVIIAESFTADCEYGVIILDDSDYLIMLKKTSGGRYDAINYNCGVTTVPISEDRLLGYDMSVDEFVEKIGSERRLISYETLSNYQGIVSDWKTTAVTIIGLIAFIFVAFLVVRVAKSNGRSV